LPKKKPILEGWLHKKGHLFKTWKLRWFVLERYRLSYYVDDKKKQLKGTYVLDAKSFIETVPDQRSIKYLFVLYAIGSGGDALTMAANSPSEVDTWVSTINSNIQKIAMKSFANIASSEIPEDINDNKIVSDVITHDNKKSKDDLIPIANPIARHEEQVKSEIVAVSATTDSLRKNSQETNTIEQAHHVDKVEVVEEDCHTAIVAAEEFDQKRIVEGKPDVTINRTNEVDHYEYIEENSVAAIEAAEEFDRVRLVEEISTISGSITS
jgi:hypothetical protein